MQELDLTYEQSKQILELGYDFSPACKEFIYKSGDYIRHFYGVKIKDSVRGYQVIENGVQKESQLVQFKPSTVPIISKAALLIALPSFERTVVSKHYEHLSFTADRDFRFIYLEETHSGNTFKIFDSEEDKEPALIKAFLWCNEKYPAELKQRFGEVIK
jgi:hypothetical protein